MKYLLVLFLISCSNGSFFNKPFAEKECDYLVPSGYSLKQNIKGKWAIKESGNQILGYSTRYQTWNYYPYDSFEASTFSDSCKAKGFLKKYIEYKSKNEFK